MHSDAARITAAGFIALFFHWAFGILFIALALRERRAAADPARGFTYGQALWAGVATALFTALFDLVCVPLYAAVINPHFNEILAQAQTAKLEARGLGPDQLDRMERVQHIFFSPGFETAAAALGAVVGGTLVALVVAVFFQRPAEGAPA
jgi:hypothetical protein